MLTSNNDVLVYETKRVLSKTFKMKDLGKVSFCLVLRLLGLSQNAYIHRVLKRCNMDNYPLGDAPIVKGDKFYKS